MSHQFQHTPSQEFAIFRGPSSTRVPRGHILRHSCCLILAGMIGMGSTSGFAQGTEVDQPTVTGTQVITPHDTIPRYCATPTVVAQQDGSWSAPNTWSTNQVPGSDARVSIPQGVTVTYNHLSDVGIDCVEIGEQGELQWATDQDTRLRVTNLQVLPNGTLTIGTTVTPIAPDHHAEVIIRDIPLDVQGQDPSQYGNGINVFGTITIHGSAINHTFVRFTNEAHAGDTTLELDQAPANWKAGDRLLIPDTRQIPFRKKQKYISQAEEPTVLSIVGSTVTLTTPLLFDHAGPRDADGQVGAIELAMLPHTGNLSRNVTLRSTRLSETTKTSFCMGAQNIQESANCITRGHVLLLRRADVDIRYAHLENLGRTTNDSLNNTTVDSAGNVTAIGLNQIGRYSLHLHRVMGPVNPSNTGHQFQLIGNVIEGMLKWGIAVHDTHYGLIKDNIAYDGQGAAITTEDGNESFNVFERNLVVHTKAGNEEQVLESPKRGGVFSSRRLFGTTRDGFWFSGMNNYVRDNVVANAPDFAYNYNGYYLTPNQPIPNFRGANMATDSTIQVALPVLESSRNEAYGATGQGLWATWSRGCCSVGRWVGRSVFLNYRIWHVNHSGAEFYHESRNTLDGFILRNDVAVTAQSQGGSLRFNRGFHFSNKSYENGQTIFRNIDMQGFNVGIRLPLRPEDGTNEPNFTLLENSYLRNYVNIEDGLPNIDVKETTIRNVISAQLNIPAISGMPAQPTSINMRYSISRHTNLVGHTGHTNVIDFNGISGNNFEVFFEEQAPDYPIPPEPSFNGRLKGCPEPNLTNQQCLDTHGVAVAGVVAPCLERDGELTCESARARAATLGIKGLVFFTNQPPTDPRPIAPSGVTVTPLNPPVAGTFTVTWDANPDGDIASYKVFQRTPPGPFGPGTDVGNVTQTMVTDLQPGDALVVTAIDNAGQESSHSIEFSIPNNSPTANDDTTSTPGATGVTIDLATNDQDTDSGIDAGTITIVNGPQHGTLAVNPDGTVTYTPHAADSFTYTIRDANGAISNVATVIIQLESVSPTP